LTAIKLNNFAVCIYYTSNIYGNSVYGGGGGGGGGSSSSSSRSGSGGDGSKQVSSSTNADLHSGDLQLKLWP
jgi:hypothetical protein